MARLVHFATHTHTISVLFVILGRQNLISIPNAHFLGSSLVLGPCIRPCICRFDSSTHQHTHTDHDRVLAPTTGPYLIPITNKSPRSFAFTSIGRVRPSHILTHSHHVSNLLASLFLSTIVSSGLAVQIICYHSLFFPTYFCRFFLSLYTRYHLQLLHTFCTRICIKSSSSIDAPQVFSGKTL